MLPLCSSPCYSDLYGHFLISEHLSAIYSCGLQDSRLNNGKHARWLLSKLSWIKRIFLYRVAAAVVRQVGKIKPRGKREYRGRSTSSELSHKSWRHCVYSPISGINVTGSLRRWNRLVWRSVFILIWLIVLNLWNTLYRYFFNSFFNYENVQKYYCYFNFITRYW